MHAGNQHVYRGHDEEVNRRGNQQEGNRRVDEVSDRKMCTADIEAEIRKIGRADDSGD